MRVKRVQAPPPAEFTYDQETSLAVINASTHTAAQQLSAVLDAVQYLDVPADAIDEPAFAAQQWNTIAPRLRVLCVVVEGATAATMTLRWVNIAAMHAALRLLVVRITGDYAPGQRLRPSRFSPTCDFLVMDNDNDYLAMSTNHELHGTLTSTVPSAAIAPTTVDPDSPAAAAVNRFRAALQPTTGYPHRWGFLLWRDIVDATVALLRALPAAWPRAAFLVASMHSTCRTRVDSVARNALRRELACETLAALCEHDPQRVHQCGDIDDRNSCNEVVTRDLPVVLRNYAQRYRDGTPQPSVCALAQDRDVVIRVRGGETVRTKFSVIRECAPVLAAQMEAHNGKDERDVECSHLSRSTVLSVLYPNIGTFYDTPNGDTHLGADPFSNIVCPMVGGDYLGSYVPWQRRGSEYASITVVRALATVVHPSAYP